MDRDFPIQEWYRYLNCGYKVAVCGGTDKMGAYADLGWQRTYALLDKEKPFSYDAWAKAVRKGKKLLNQQAPLKLGKYEKPERPRILSGIIGHVAESFPQHDIDQIMLYRAKGKPTNMSLTILT